MSKKEYEVRFSFTTSLLKIRYFDNKADALRWWKKVVEFAKIHSLHGKISLFHDGWLVVGKRF